MGYFGHPVHTYGEPPGPPACNNQSIPPTRPLITVQPLTAHKVLACRPSNAFNVANPFDVLTQAVARAVAMLDNTINRLVTARAAVCQGTAPTPALLDDPSWTFMRRRLNVCVDDPQVWRAGAFTNLSVAEIIRRLARVRDLIASNGILYICNPANCDDGGGCGPGTWAFVCMFCDGGPERSVIRLCHDFWIAGQGVSAADHAEFQAQTIIHEASHLYYCTVDRPPNQPNWFGFTIGVAECLTQFVAISNGAPIDPDFVAHCTESNRCVVPAAGAGGGVAGFGGYAGFGAAGPRRSHILKTVFHPQNAVRPQRVSPARLRTQVR
jgi:hypothetical protein